MKIALMTNNYKPIMGGVPISIERLKISLEKQGHEVTVFAPTYTNQKEETGVMRYGNLLNRFIGGIVLPNPFDSMIEKRFSEQQFDIIHVHHPFLIGNVAMHLSRKYKIPLVFTYHTQYEQYLYAYAKWASPLGKILPLYLKLFLKHCDYVFAPTLSMQEYLHTVCRVPYEKMDILPTGLPEEHFYVTDIEKKAVRKQYEAENIPLFLTVSRMAQEKNVEFLIRSLEQFKRKYHKPFRVLFIGDGPDRASYEKLCQQKQLTDTIYFTGKIENDKIPVYFATADAFLFASKTETQGIVILEAFAGKTPVYAVNAPGVCDIVRDGFNGRLLPENEALFSDALIQFQKGDESAYEMSQNAYVTALQFREEAVAVKAVQLYNKAIVTKNQEPQNKRETCWAQKNKRFAV